MPLDLDCQKVLDLYAMAGRPPLEQQPVPEAREAFMRGRAILQPDPPAVAETRDLTAPGPAGPIPLRLYRPQGAPEGALPMMVYYHGGGWVIGDLDSHDTLCRQLANGSGACVIAVDYRLAPEHRFPAAVEDAWAALRWIAAHAVDLRIDPARIAVGGDSAGGNLAAVVALMARDNGGPALRLQLLIYPVVDFDIATDSYKSRADVLPLTRAAMVWFRDHYFGPDHASSGVSTDWRAAPLRAESLADLPPTYMITGGYDVLCTEGSAYADRLEAAGVTVQRAHYPGLFHGFIGMGRVIATANEATAACAKAMRSALA